LGEGAVSTALSGRNAPQTVGRFTTWPRHGNNHDATHHFTASHRSGAESRAAIRELEEPEVDRRLMAVPAALALVACGATSAFANSTPHVLTAGAFVQNWTNTGLISVDDNWTNVPAIVGYRGDGLAATAGTDPRTITADSTVVDVNANKTDPNAFATGGVTEFEITNPTVALAGSNTAQAPYLLINLDTRVISQTNVSYTLRDLESGSDDAIQQVALQYRVGSSGTWSNVSGTNTYVADATTGPNTIGPDIPVSAVLPAPANDKALVQVRVITTNAINNDEWVGVDNINITGQISTAARWLGGSATLARRGVNVNWRAGLDVDTVGFDVLRARTGARRVKVSRRLVAAGGLTSGQGSRTSFRFTDRRGRAGDRYFIRERLTNGTTKIHGPLTARPTKKAA
jgi:hypothetical protein